MIEFNLDGAGGWSAPLATEFYRLAVQVGGLSSQAPRLALYGESGA